MSGKTIFWSILWILTFAQANGQTQQALVLSPISIFADSSFSAATVGHLTPGQLVEVLQKSKVLHEDKTQTQQFFWYLVADTLNHTGWTMGDEIAILDLAPNQLTQTDQMSGGPYTIGPNFEESVFFWGKTYGKDDLSSHFSASNQYHENYIVFVNPNGETKHLPVGTQSERGTNICKGIYFADLTKDGYQEIILYRSLSGKEMDEEVRKLEIYQLVDGAFKMIFEQRLNLYFDSPLTSPARFKFVDITPDGIRIEYPDYGDCASTHFGVGIQNQPVTFQKCMSWVTESYTWDKVSSQFNHFYAPSSLPLRAHIKKEAIFLREKPSLRSTSVKLLQKKERLQVLEHLETISYIKNKKVARIFFLVKTSDGITGYLPSDQIVFIHTAHAPILNQFYTNPLVSKRDWQGEQEFVRLRDFKKAAHWEVTGNFISN